MRSTYAILIKSARAVGCKYGTASINGGTITNEAVKAIIAKQLGINPATINDNVSLTDLGADELDLIEILMDLEWQFGKELPSNIVDWFDTDTSRYNTSNLIKQLSTAPDSTFSDQYDELKLKRGLIDKVFGLFKRKPVSFEEPVRESDYTTDFSDDDYLVPISPSYRKQHGWSYIGNLPSEEELDYRESLSDEDAAIRMRESDELSNRFKQDYNNLRKLS